MAEHRRVLPSLDERVLRQWIGRTRTVTDRIDPRRARLLQATLDPAGRALQAGDRLPGGWHWIYFPDATPIDRLGDDGHAALGEFLPPVALPRRMWAGTRLRFHAPILLGDELVRESRVAAVTRKTGRSGELCFVTVRHRHLRSDELALEEEHDIVYAESRSATNAGAPPRAPAGSQRSMTFSPSTVLLFRYSALTFNGHRIHYDLDYCRDVEGYPGLVIHAPLLATLMLGLAEKLAAERSVTLREFRQRSASPLFHPDPVRLHLSHSETGCDLWASGADGRLGASAAVSWQTGQADCSTNPLLS